MNRICLVSSTTSFSYYFKGTYLVQIKMILVSEGGLSRPVGSEVAPFSQKITSFFEHLSEKIEKIFT
jgi:hypothetical protein